MNDRRLTPATDRVALESWRDRLNRPDYTEGRPARIAVAVTDICRSPGGARDRQALFGADVTVIDRRDGFSFVQAALDGYCGWIADGVLSVDLPPVTHRVTAPASHIYPRPDMKTREIAALSIGARLSGTPEGRFLRLAGGGFVPIQHVGQGIDGPVAVAESLLGTPYLWGGNSRAGIDCSGLAQMALTMAGIPCPGDSDMQRDAFPEVEDIRRGDLLFWPGHVALAVSSSLMIHATAWKMAVIHEGITEAIQRIDMVGEGPFLGARRPPPQDRQPAFNAGSERGAFRL